MRAILAVGVSPDNVEIVRQVYGAVARRDRAAVLRLYDPMSNSTFPGSLSGA
jgi:hypothetical protein